MTGLWPAVAHDTIQRMSPGNRIPFLNSCRERYVSKAFSKNAQKNDGPVLGTVCFGQSTGRTGTREMVFTVENSHLLVSEAECIEH